MRTCDLLTAIRNVEKGRGLCFRPLQCVGTGVDLMFTIKNGRIEPDLPNVVSVLLSKWVVQTITSVEKEIRQRETGCSFD